MRILHTSDWHLGKRLYQHSRLAEQKLFLKWLVKYIQSEHIDVVIIAGDIFDTPNPPHEALEIYYQFLQNFLNSPEKEIYIIGGNHDSGRFLEAPRPLLAGKSVHISGKLSGEETLPTFQLKSAAKLSLLPFFRTSDLLMLKGNSELSAGNAPHLREKELINTLAKLLERTKRIHNPSGLPHLLMAHHNVGGMSYSGSELTVGLTGIDSLPIELFHPHFDYVALGHMHNFQNVGKEKIPAIYSGAPIPLKFGEIKQKSLSLVTIEKGVLSYQKIPIPCFRPLISIKASKDHFEDALLKALEHRPATELHPFLEVELSVDRPEIGLASKVRESVKNVDVELISFRLLTERDQQMKQASLAPHDFHDPLRLFETFYRYKYPAASEINPEMIGLFKEILENIRRSTSSGEEMEVHRENSSN